MPIYDKPVRSIFPEMINDLVPDDGQIFLRDDAVEWFKKRYPKIKQGTISGGRTVH